MARPQQTLSQDPLYTLLTQLPFGLMVLDMKGMVLTSNPAAELLLKDRFGWVETEDHHARSLPWEIRTGVEYLLEALRRKVYQNSTPALTLTSPDLYLHLALLVPKENAGGRGSGNRYVVVVLKSHERSLTELWEGQAGLTPREEEVLTWLARGKTRKEISVILNISEATVRTHIEHLYAKLGVTSKVEAASAALRRQLAASLTAQLPLS